MTILVVVFRAFEDKLKNGSNFFRFFRSEYDKDYESRNRTTGKLTAFDLIERKSTLLEAKGTREWNKNHLLTFGGEYQQENFKGTRFNTGQGYYTVSRAGLTQYGNGGDYQGIMPGIFRMNGLYQISCC